MATYYVFTGQKTFFKVKSLMEASYFSKKGKNVYQKVPSIPNPWYVHPFENGTVNKNKILFHSEDKIKDVSAKYL